MQDTDDAVYDVNSDNDGFSTNDDSDSDYDPKTL